MNIFFGSTGMHVGRDQRGFILVVVLWVVALLAIMAAAYSRSVQSTVREAFAATRVAKVEAILDGGAALVLHDLAGSGRRGATRRFGEGAAVGCRFSDNGTLTIHVSDAAGRVNLNTASRRLIAGLLAGLGMEGEPALALAQHIIDFRDRDDVTEQDAPERDAYVAAGLPLGAKDAPFDTLLELQRVPHMTDAITAAMTPYVTLYSGIDKVDERVAPPRLIGLINAGIQKLPLSLSEQTSFVGDRLPADLTAPSPRQVFAVTISAQLDDGSGPLVRDVVVDIQNASDPRPKLISWTPGTPLSDPAASDAADLPPC